MTAKKLIIILLSVLVALIVIRTIINLSQPPKSSEQSPEVQAAMEEMEKLSSGQEDPKPDPEPEAEAEESTEQEQAADLDFDGLTMGQQNALKQALSYLDYSSFSRAGLIDQLSSEHGSNFPREDAEFAVGYIEEHEMVDWNEQAIRQAESYLDYSVFSRAELVDQLSSEHGSQFTAEQAEQAVSYLEENNLVDWNEQAVKQAKSYLEYSAFSKNDLIDQLSSEHGSQFTREQAEYAVSQVGY